MRFFTTYLQNRTRHTKHRTNIPWSVPYWYFVHADSVVPRIKHCKTRREQIDTITYQPLIDSTVKTTIAFPTGNRLSLSRWICSGYFDDRRDSFRNGHYDVAKCTRLGWDYFDRGWFVQLPRHLTAKMSDHLFHK